MWLLPLLVLVVSPLSVSGFEDAAAVEFFEKRIRPVLAQRCYECHSERSAKAKGELRVDSREALAKGGETGPAIDSAKPMDSLLLRAVRYVHKDLQMPPKEKDRLTPGQVKDFEHWIASGAVFPKSQQPMAAGKKEDLARSHWAFQPVEDVSPPSVRDKSWPRTPIDHFILAKLEASQIVPAPMADARTLIRRATFDLHGLPPTPEEVQVFIEEIDREGKSQKADELKSASAATPDAYSRLIDRLLASPRYGERWGRYWLDLSRYSDTKGYVYGDREERFFVHAHAYRDWVIRALNEDMPYDRFLLLQIAADQVLADEQLSKVSQVTQQDLAAIGHLTIGRRFLGVIHDIIDDRIDTLFRTTQGLSVGCARCHDHKFDPVPTEDYYSLYGVFANTTERAVSLTTTPPDTEAYRAFEKELLAREAKLRDAFAAKRTEWSDRVRAQSAEYLLALLATDKLWTEEFYAFVQVGEVNPPFVRQWQSYLFRRNQAGFDAVFEPWHRLIKLRQESFEKESVVIVESLLDAKSPVLNGQVAAALKSAKLTSMQDVARMYGRLLVDADNAWRDLRKKDANARALPDVEQEALRLVLYAPGSPVLVPDRSIYEAEFFFDEGTRVQLAKLAAQIDQWLINSGGATPHAVILDDIPAEHQRVARVFRRGNPATPGKEVPRQFLSLLAGSDRQPFTQGSGRLEMARAIVDPKNPLTARVMVNRIWQHHFGAGLVTTPSDFGIRADPPSHPHLLDHLAAQFIREQWSMKKLHRQIMTSATYRQASERPAPTDGPTAAPTQKAELETRNAPALIDPTNRLLWHFPRQRLDFEAMRDAMLLTSGELDATIGGRPVDLFKQPFTLRRSVYGLVDRQFFPGELRMFDVASPDLHTPARSATTVPQQALFFMNSAFVKQRATALVRRVEKELPQPIASAGASSSKVGSAKSEAAAGRLARLHQLLYQRPPTQAELSLGLAFIETLEAEDREIPAPAAPKPSAWTYGYGELDEKAGRVKAFAKLPHFTGQAWQGGGNWPDAKLGWVQLTAEGGHAGNDLKHAAIRRWTAPRAMKISIVSSIRHEHAAGDGIRAFIVHGRTNKETEAAATGVLGSWALQNQLVESNIASVEVKQGDVIDFIVDIRGNLNNDDFVWKPVISEVAPQVNVADAPAQATAQWNSRAEFAGVVSAPPAPMSAWEMYAQALLLGNEFMFVD